jgi:hypothetical protein
VRRCLPGWPLQAARLAACRRLALGWPPAAAPQAGWVRAARHAGRALRQLPHSPGPAAAPARRRPAPAGDQPVARELRAAFEDLFRDFSVDMTWHGHHHSYQRTCPVHKGACQGYSPEDGSARGTVHLVIGHAGAGLTENVEAEPAPHWEVIRLWWGFLRVRASGTELLGEVVSDSDGGLMDSFRLVKPRGWGEAFMARLAAGGGGLPKASRRLARQA